MGRLAVGNNRFVLPVFIIIDRNDHENDPDSE